jgi:hypothetical protein
MSFVFNSQLYLQLISYKKNLFCIPNKKIAIPAKMETTNGQKVFGFLKQMLSVTTLLCLDFILEMWTAFDLFYCGLTKQGIETTGLILAPFVAKVIVLYNNSAP